MPRGIDRSPASTLLGLAPLALTAWIGKSWTRLPRGQGNGVVLVVLISFSFVWPDWRPLRRRKTSGRYLAQPRKGAEVIRLPAARIARILPTSGKGMCSAFRIVTKTMVQTRSNFEKGETDRPDRRYLRVAN